jgi:Fe-S-cluster formation regulator IscX/YfhJ
MLDPLQVRVVRLVQAVVELEELQVLQQQEQQTLVVEAAVVEMPLLH